MVRSIQLFAAYVAVGYRNNLGVALHTERQLVGAAEHPTSLGVNGIDAQVLQVGAVGLPRVVVVLHLQSHRRSRRFKGMTRYRPTLSVCYSLYLALFIGYVVPAYLVALLCVGGVLTTS